MVSLFNGRMALIRTPIFLILLVIASVATAEETEKTRKNLEYVAKILSYLNDNEECILPTFEEVDELQRTFTEMQMDWGDDFENKLSDDQKLVLRSLLMNWELFRQSYNEPVVQLSSMKRTFLCKVESYQRKKFGKSICTGLKNVRGPMTDRIFEKNPHVRYIKHLKTGQVADLPSESDIKLEAEDRAKEEEEKKVKAYGEEKARVEAEEMAHAEAEERARIAAEEAKSKAEAEEKVRLEAQDKARIEADELARAEEQARVEAEALVKAEKEAEEKRMREIEERARVEAEEAKVQARIEEDARLATLAKIKADEKSRADAEEKATEQARLETEAKIKEETIRKAKVEAEERAKAQEKARIDAEEKARAEEQARLDAVKRAEAKAEARVRAEKEALEKVRLEEERVKAEAKARAEAEIVRAKEEAERKAKIDAEELARAEEQARVKALKRAEAEAEAEAKVRAAKEAQERAIAEERARVESEKKNLDMTQEETQMGDVKHNYIGHFVIELDRVPRKITLTIEHDLDDGDERDPLVEIPVPHFDEDDFSDERQPGTSKVAGHGFEYLDAKDDDADLERIVRVPDVDWQFDEIYDHFEWPDECIRRYSGYERNNCDKNSALDDEMLKLGGDWTKFLDDPFEYDKQKKRDNPFRRMTKGEIRRRLDGIAADRIETLAGERLLGHDRFYMAPPPPAIVWPEGVNKDRWRHLADNNYCKIAFNQGRIVHKTKNGFRAVKTFTVGAVVSSRRRLLSGKK